MRERGELSPCLSSQLSLSAHIYATFDLTRATCVSGSIAWGYGLSASKPMQIKHLDVKHKMPKILLFICCLFAQQEGIFDLWNKT